MTTTAADPATSLRGLVDHLLPHLLDQLPGTDPAWLVDTLTRAHPRTVLAGCAAGLAEALIRGTLDTALDDGLIR